MPVLDWPLVYIGVLLLTAVPCMAFGARPARLIAYALLVNLLLTRFVGSFGGSVVLVGVADFVCAYALLTACRSLSGKSVAAMFAAMIAFYAAHTVNLVNENQMWACVDALAYIQIVLMLGAAAHGQGRFDRLGSKLWRSIRSGNRFTRITDP